MHRLTAPGGRKTDPWTLSYPNPEGQAATTRLTTCVECINSIIDEQLLDEDKIGLLAFSHRVHNELELRAKAGNEQTIKDAVSGLRTRGRTAFYKAIKVAVEQMQARGAEEPKWIVALTDGRDTDSHKGDLDTAVRALEDTAELNLALITLGNDVDMAAINRMREAAQNGAHPNMGIHVEANNLQAVKRAFGEIAKEMAAPTSGAV